MQADVFLSYAEEDRARAGAVSNALEALGWSVWWDREIAPGSTWRETIERAIEGTRCMVVLWSESSIVSRWVHEEAEEGLARARLVPVLIEPVRPPMGFRSVQVCDLSGWEGDPKAADFVSLTKAISALAGPPQRGAASPTRPTAARAAAAWARAVRVGSRYRPGGIGPRACWPVVVGEYAADRGAGVDAGRRFPARSCAVARRWPGVRAVARTAGGRAAAAGRRPGFGPPGGCAGGNGAHGVAVAGYRTEGGDAGEPLDAAARCASVLERMQLGEPVSDAERAGARDEAQDHPILALAIGSPAAPVPTCRPVRRPAPAPPHPRGAALSRRRSCRSMTRCSLPPTTCSNRAGVPGHGARRAGDRSAGRWHGRRADRRHPGDG